MSPVLQLSPRLKLIFDQLLPGLPVWDLCCDHGYLGLYAYSSSLFPEINFVDQVPEIIERLERAFAAEIKAPLNHTTTYFIATPANELSQELYGNVVIAGVGSYTVFQIIKALQARHLLKAQRLILCPQNEVIKIDEIEQLPGFGFRRLQQALTVKEKDRLRTVFVLDRISN